MTGEDNNNELDYTKCWVKVTVGSELYETTNLLKDDPPYNSSTGGQSFGQITYEGSFSNNKFVGYYDNVTNNGNIIDSVSGTIAVELNETHDMVTDVSFTRIIKNHNSGLNSSNYREEEFSGKNIPIDDINDQSTFKVVGSQTCDHIVSLDVYHVSIIPNDPNNNYEETLKSFQCDLGGEQITVFFSK